MDAREPWKVLGPRLPGTADSGTTSIGGTFLPLTVSADGRGGFLLLYGTLLHQSATMQQLHRITADADGGTGTTDTGTEDNVASFGVWPRHCVFALNLDWIPEVIS